jgi:hypothetical protein
MSISNPFTKQADTEKGKLKRQGYSNGAAETITKGKRENTIAKVFGKPIKPL